MGIYVYAFAQGDRSMSDLLGGKGANLAEMVSLGLPVPPGFTIATSACQVYLESGSQPAELQEKIDTALTEREKSMGKRLGREKIRYWFQ